MCQAHRRSATLPDSCGHPLWPRGLGHQRLPMASVCHMSTYFLPRSHLLQDPFLGGQWNRDPSVPDTFPALFLIRLPQQQTGAFSGVSSSAELLPQLGTVLPHAGPTPTICGVLLSHSLLSFDYVANNDGSNDMTMWRVKQCAEMGRWSSERLHYIPAVTQRGSDGTALSPGLTDP